MKSATISDLRYNFPRVEAWFSGGEEVQLTKRGIIIGRIIPGAARIVSQKTPDFAARAKRIFGDRIIDTAAILDYNKGHY